MKFPSSILANTPLTDRQFFYSTGATWQVWNKPAGKGLAYIFCIGAGAGGGVGASNNTGGGGGGGSGGLARLLVPLWMLPDTLYVQVGVGGAPSSAGAKSFVSIRASNTAANLYVTSGNAAATAGGAGGAGEGSAGAAETIASVATCILEMSGQFGTIAGVPGVVGNSSIVALASIPLTGGAGGGTNAGTNGGNITGAGPIPTISGGIGGSAGTNGNSGITLWGVANGFMSCGGSGGGGGSSTTGGVGGNGGIGSGGGGGGAGVATGGAGGSGGNGFVGIWCF